MESQLHQPDSSRTQPGRAESARIEPASTESASTKLAPAPVAPTRGRRRDRQGSLSPEAVERLWDDRVQTHAEVAVLCATRRIRLLAACGPVVSHFGFVSPKVISTASVLVDPSSTTHLVDELTAQGWVVDAMKRGARLLPHTSVTLSHPTKTCRLNVYYLVPGSQADPEEAFDMVWERRVAVLVGDVAVPSLDRSLIVLLMALALSGQLPGVPRAVNGAEMLLVQLKAISTPEEIDDIVTTAWRLRGTTALHGLLTAWGRNLEHVQLLPERYAIWRLKVGSANQVTRAMLAIVEAPRGLRWAVTRASLRTLERFPGPLAILHSARVVATAKKRLQDAAPSDPRGSGWSTVEA